MIGLIDIGVGNVSSIKRSLLEIGVFPISVTNSRDLDLCTHLIFPGVGSFDKAISSIHKHDLFYPLIDFLHKPNKSYLGICVGMHILYSHSEEGSMKGLSLFDSSVIRLTNTDGLALPTNYGFREFNYNTFEFVAATYYYMHSYGVSCYNHVPGSFTYYDNNFLGFISDDLNNWGAQFHPERSSFQGLYFFRSFLGLSN